MSLIEVKVPDIGDFDAVEIIEILVAEGDSISENQDIITLESDKAAMEIPSSAAGIIKSLKVKVGDKVAQGDLILTLESEADSATEEKPAETEKESAKPAETKAEKPAEKPQAAPTAKAELATDADMQAEVVVLGSGPGGYTAAFRAADLGKQVILIERHQRIGGVCLNVGCIPSKALLHTAHVINEAKHIAENGVTFGAPKIDIRKVADWKDSIVSKLTGGLSALAKQRKVTVVHGEAQFAGANLM
ncbi:MAG: FAD-dependent oxidoreductase, partial [Methylophaga nitratireducenticrescens]